MVGIFIFWLVGYALAFGDGNAFSGLSEFALQGTKHSMYAFWFLQYTYAATPPSIVQGAVTERVSYIASMIQTFFLVGITYPIVVHWSWADQGWLHNGFAIEGNSTIVFQVSFFSSIDYRKLECLFSLFP